MYEYVGEGTGRGKSISNIYSSSHQTCFHSLGHLTTCIIFLIIGYHCQNIDKTISPKFQTIISGMDLGVGELGGGGGCNPPILLLANSTL